MIKATWFWNWYGVPLWLSANHLIWSVVQWRSGCYLPKSLARTPYPWSCANEKSPVEYLYFSGATASPCRSTCLVRSSTYICMNLKYLDRPFLAIALFSNQAPGYASKMLLGHHRTPWFCVPHGHSCRQHWLFLMVFRIGVQIVCLDTAHVVCNCK